jgi:hypothetical protein
VLDEAVASALGEAVAAVLGEAVASVLDEAPGWLVAAIHGMLHRAGWARIIRPG